MDSKQGLIAMLLGIVSTFMLGMAHSASVQMDSPVGYWKTIDDVTGKPSSIVQIWKADNQVLVGKVVKVFPKEGSHSQSQSVLCKACQGDLRNQPIVGMVILSGLKSTQKTWSHGKLLDPENGKTYNCALRTLDNGKKLDVKGYIGLPLLGRTQTWERVDLMSA